MGVLVVEFVLGNVVVPASRTETTLRVAASLEWVVLVVLLVWWVSRIEHSRWWDIGIGSFQVRHLWVGAAWFVAATGVSAGAGLDAPGSAVACRSATGTRRLARPALAALKT